ncbi:hypothetical protein BVRB_6g150420 [Beta vulgaris subsp. vulgaris]|nr:hypothetical protein BVRB_6g150420 [Beta vulgaris subsp. vulgaris]
MYFIIFEDIGYERELAAGFLHLLHYVLDCQNFGTFLSLHLSKVTSYRLTLVENNQVRDDGLLQDIVPSQMRNDQPTKAE